MTGLGQQEVLGMHVAFPFPVDGARRVALHEATDSEAQMEKSLLFWS